MTQMTCREFDEIVHGVARLELLDVALREDAFEHARHCSACGERLAAAHALAETTAEYSESSQNRKAPPRVEAVLLAAFRQRNQRKRWLRAFEWSAAGLAAAGLVLLLWAGWIGFRGPSSRTPEKAASTPQYLPAEAARQSSPEASKAGSEAVAETAELSAPTDSTEEFVALPYTGSMGPEDSGMIVRVEVSIASLAQLGYPVAATPEQGMVRADVLIGEDGQPRAVRLVR